MNRTSVLMGTALLLFGLLVAVPPSASASSGLQAQLSQQCVFVVQGGTAHDNLTITVPGGGSPRNISAGVVGSVPQNSKMTLSPTFGTSPLLVHITIRANATTPTGAFQVGVVATSGLSYHISLFTLRVVSSASAESPVCNTIGLPLPESTFVVTLTSIGLGLLTQTVTRRVVDLQKERRMKAELSAFNKEKRQATAANDKAKLEKLKKKELPMRQANAKVQMARTKVTLVTFVPLLLVYYLMASFLGGYGSIVAVSPIPLPVMVGSSGEMVLIWWYFLGSFTLASLLSRLLHTNT